jgi:hypothetical protein
VDSYVQGGCVSLIDTSLFDTEGGLTDVDTPAPFTRATGTTDGPLVGSTVGDWFNAQGVATTAASSTIKGYILASLVLAVLFPVMALGVVHKFPAITIIKGSHVVAWHMLTWAVLVVLTGIFWQFVYTPLDTTTNAVKRSPHFHTTNATDDFTAYLVKYLAILLVVVTSCEAAFKAYMNAYRPKRRRT